MTMYHFTYKDTKTNKVYKSYVRAENIQKGIQILRESVPNGNTIKSLAVKKV